ncbi:hypothetical protein FNV43_RR02536 [Rhamnella rubrinervis]|uniref:Uncharacterized protein n=1 Tax=Rhamnella rubrinervis TaxID=2594499 RepID=A0A8K0HRN3_9ROSA|nr:hypothetical protein FNV43_RR02536 [Rhamnella rubrinervis]
MRKARALECPKTAYMSLTNATTIAAKKYDKPLVLSCFRAKKRWIKTAELENTMAMVSDTMNAAFFIELQLPVLVLLHSHNRQASPVEMRFHMVDRQLVIICFPWQIDYHINTVRFLRLLQSGDIV